MKDATQESHSLSGFTGVVKGMMGNQDVETPRSDHPPREGSSLFLHLEKNNFNDNYDDPLNFDSAISQTRPHQRRPNIDIVSLDASRSKESQLPNQIAVFNNMQSMSSTNGGGSPTLLRPQHNLHQIKKMEEDEGRESNVQAKTETPINVIARVRPLIPNEIRHPVCIEVVDESVVNGSKTQIVVRQGIVGPSVKSSDQKIYSFEKVLDTDTSQQKVFADVDGISLCNAFINGQNCTIFVYGPTSTGKTFTMQGNAEDIIHSNNNQTLRSQIVSNNASPDQSRISQADDSMITNDFEIKHFTPTKGKKLFSAHKKLGVPGSNRQQSNSFHIGRGSISGVKDEDSPAKKNFIGRVARDMLAEAKDKGIIQRVLDNIFLKFAERADLAQNCEIKISFLEIYKETVTDLLGGHSERRVKLRHNRNHSSSMGFDGGKMDDDQNSQLSANKRMKAKTFYNDQELEDIVKQKRNNLEMDNHSPPFGFDNSLSGRHKDERASFRASSFREPKKQYQVKENAVKGVYVTNLSEVVCETAEMAYHCLLDGLMRKRMSQTARNTSSSRSHTIFQIKMYMKAQDTQSLLLPQYQQMQESEVKLVSKFCLIDLAGSERIIEAEKNAERIDEARFINKSLSALGNVVAALRTQAKKTNQANKPDQTLGTGMDSRRSSFHAQDLKTGRSSRRVSGYEQRAPPMQHIPFRDSKLTHILKDCLGSNSFTHLIICLSPSYLCLAESISTLAFTKNAKAVKQNIVENVQFKSDLIQRNLAAQGGPRGGSHTVKHKPNQGNSLLSQMAGNNDEETAMLKEIMAEFGGENLDGMSIKQLFRLTMEQMKRFQENQQDLQKTIVEMKQAMEKDLNNNPRAIEIITNAHSDYQQKSNSFHSAGNKSPTGAAQCYPGTSSENGLFGLKQYSAQNYASAHTTTQQHTLRNGSLKSITEENYSASITSPQACNGSSLTHQYVWPHGTTRWMPSLNGDAVHLDIVHKKKKQASSTSIMTFAGYNNQEVIMRNRESQNNLFGQNKKSGISSSKLIDQHHNSCETQGGLHQLREEDDSTAYIDTEPGEVNDERNPCSCALTNPHQHSTAVIPVQNLMKLQAMQDFNTMRSIVTKYLKQLIRKRILIEQIKSPGKRSIVQGHSLGLHHKRQRSWDNQNFKIHQERMTANRTGGSKAPVTRTNNIDFFQDKTKRAHENAYDHHPQKLMPQACLDIDRELRSIKQSSNSSNGQENEGFTRHALPYEQHAQGHFTKIDKAGMKYFMPKMLKSMSCPNYQSDCGQPKTDQKTTSKQNSSQYDEEGGSSSYNHQKGGAPGRNRQSYESQELEISDIYSESSNDILTDPNPQHNSVKHASDKDAKFDQDFESSPEKKTDSVQGIDDCPFIYPGTNSAGSLRDNSKKSKQGKAEKSSEKMAGMLKFEQSQGTQQNNLFENSRISGTNSHNSQQPTLAQSQSQKTFNTLIGKGNFGSQARSQVRVIQLNDRNSQRHLLQKSPQKLNSNLKVPSTMSMKQKTQSQPKAKGGQSKQLSVISNEILVVEEINDNELETEAFQRIRKTNNQLVGSVNSNVSKDRGMGCLIDCDKLQQHTGSMVEQQQQSKQSTISSIQFVQNSNKSFVSNTKTFLSKKSPGPKTPSSKKLVTHKSKERIAPKTFITDLNKALPRASQTGGPKNNKLLGMLLDPKKQTSNRTPVINSRKSNYKIPSQISNTVRKQTNSFQCSTSGNKPVISQGIPMTQQSRRVNPGVQVLDFQIDSRHSKLINSSPPMRQTAYSNHNPGGNTSAPSKLPFRSQLRTNESKSTLMQMKPKKQSLFAHKISQPLAGMNPDSHK